MPITTVRMVPGGHLMSADIKQYADLLLGTMTDQPVTLSSTLSVGGAVTVLQIGTPAPPPSGRMKLYPKADGMFYFLQARLQRGRVEHAGSASEDGEPGPPGAAGATGRPGAVGSQGPQGLKGDPVCKVPEGDTGNTGSTGATGSQGPPGTTGAQGPQGIPGPEGPEGPQGEPGESTPAEAGDSEEFLPAAAATTITLVRPPTEIWMVTRDGLAQSQADGHWSLAGSTLTFTDAFNGTERVIVSYGFGLVYATGPQGQRVSRVYREPRVHRVPRETRAIRVRRVRKVR